MCIGNTRSSARLDEQRADRRLVRPGACRRGSRRQADRRRRWWLPDVLCRRQDSVAAAPCARRDCTRCAFASTSKAPRFWRSRDEVALPVAILAGGLATRLRPITETHSEGLAGHRWRTVLAHQLRLLQAHGHRPCRHLCLGHLGEHDPGARPGRHALRGGRRVLVRRPELLGTGRRIAKRCRCWARPSSCSTATRICRRLRRGPGGIRRAAGKPALMTVFRNEGSWDTSNVEFARRPHRCATTRRTNAGDAAHRLRPRRLIAGAFRRRAGDERLRPGSALSETG